MEDVARARHLLHQFSEALDALDAAERDRFRATARDEAAAADIVALEDYNKGIFTDDPTAAVFRVTKVGRVRADGSFYGAGFYTSVNSDYDAAEKARQTVDEFNESVNLDGLLQVAAREIVAFGNSFWEKITQSKFESLKVLP